MGEKRILCTKVSGECRCFNEVKEDDLWMSETDVPGCYCCRNNGWERITKDKCKSCNKAEYEGITREQAIEKMAAALQSVAVDRGGVDLDDDSTLDPRMLAEAALDALLEANNEK